MSMKAVSRIKEELIRVQRALWNKQPGFIVALFLLALLVRVLFFLLYFNGSVAHGSDKEYMRLAKSLIDGRGYVDPAHSPPRIKTYPYPLYPVFIAIHYAIFDLSEYPVIVSQLVLSSLTVVIIFLMAREAIGSKGAYVAGLLAVVHFPFVLWPAFVLTETLSLFLIVVSFFLFLRSSSSQRKPDLGAGTALLGLAALCRPDNGVFLPAILLWLLLQRDHPRRAALNALLVLLVFLVVFSPWPIRNYLVSGDPRLLRSGPFSLGMQWDKLLASDGHNFPGMYGQTWLETITFVVQHPGAYLGMAWDKFWRTWLVPLYPGVSTLQAAIRIVFADLSILALGFALVQCLRRRVNRASFSLLFLLWLAKTSFILVTFPDWNQRFRLTIDPIAIIFIAYAVTTLVLENRHVTDVASSAWARLRQMGHTLGFV